MAEPDGFVFLLPAKLEDSNGSVRPRSSRFWATLRKRERVFLERYNSMLEKVPVGCAVRRIIFCRYFSTLYRGHGRKKFLIVA